MQVGTATSGSSEPASTAWAQSSSSVDYDAFLKLLVAQMKNQDPTAPMDSSEYIAQLASFSNVEQSVKANARLDALLAAQALAQADGIIGRTVTSEDGTITGEVTALRVISGGAVAILADGQELLLGPGVTVT